MNIESIGLTLAMNIEVSMTALMCFKYPLPSRPDRNAFIDGFFNSHTKMKENTSQ